MDRSLAIDYERLASMDTKIKKTRKRLLLRVAAGLSAAALVLAVVGVWQRHNLLAHVLRLRPELAPQAPAEEGVEWFDDYYTVEELAPGLYAIGEPRYHQLNYNYLIVGEREALLFDAGPGVRDIRPVVRSLTSLPYTAVFSHLHYDHVAHGQFERLAMVDLPHLRARAGEAGALPLLAKEHLGHVEGIEAPVLQVTRWLAPDETIELGGRRVRVLYTPGHTTDSISLYDEDARILLSGDWFTEYLGIFLSNGSNREMRASIQLALATVSPEVTIYPAHKYEPGTRAPRPLGYTDLEAALAGMDAVIEGQLRPSSRLYPTRFDLSDRVVLYADIPMLQRNVVSYPELLPPDP
ncbi:beta-lactamase-like protein [Plesiocystis pacifica SIR-1]|uniref:Beta-lactamase-like protein n=1 Tax=Plesiocystis pacifica SIR-1 TaxID=391625 RepID=A6GHH4_9BACT|nr:MBL fold metallo-hydrolase [Plesiocystis pacifica]EDM74691.1 beta-lactamase-like protein [Plesiocystis pacifica SIR-1]